MSWLEADEYCKEDGGKLVEIDSEKENTDLVEEINRRGYPEKNMSFWMGMTDAESEGDWRLASSGLKPSYLNWHQGEPKNGNGDQHCALLRALLGREHGLMFVAAFTRSYKELVQ